MSKRMFCVGVLYGSEGFKMYLNKKNKMIFERSLKEKNPQVSLFGNINLTSDHISGYKISDVKNNSEKLQGEKFYNNKIIDFNKYRKKSLAC